MSSLSENSNYPAMSESSENLIEFDYSEEERRNVSMYLNSDYFTHHFDSRVELSHCSFTSCYGVMLSSFDQKIYIYVVKKTLGEAFVVSFNVHEIAGMH